MRPPGARFPPPLASGARRPGLLGPASSAPSWHDDGAAHRRPPPPPAKAARLRRPASVWFGGLLILLGVLTYVLVITHHLSLPHLSLPSLSSGSAELLHRLSSSESRSAPSGAVTKARSATAGIDDAEAALEAAETAALKRMGRAADVRSSAAARKVVQPNTVQDSAAAKKAAMLAEEASLQAEAEQAAAAAKDIEAAKATAAAERAAAAKTAALAEAQAAADKQAAAEAFATKAAEDKAAAELAERTAAAAKLAADKAAADQAAAAEAAAAQAAQDKAAAEKAAEKAAADKAAADKAAADKAAADKAAADKAAADQLAADKAAADLVAAHKQAAESQAAAAAAAAASAVLPPTRRTSCPELTRELVARRAKNNTIMLTATDWKIFETMGVNWMKHLAKRGIDYYLVAATDVRTGEFLASSDHHGAGDPPCFNFMEPGQAATTSNEYKYGDAHYKAATWRKVTVVEKIVDWGFNVLHSDVDVVWFRDPLPYFLGPPLAYADIAVSTDLISTGNAEGDDGLEVSIHQHVNANTGVYFVKGTPGGQRFMADWAALRVKMGHENDQVGLYTYLRRNRAVVSSALRRMSFHDETVHVGLLSVSMLLNGYSYFIPKLHLHHHDALAVHLTWVPLSREGKFQRMRDGMLYHDPPEYYSEPHFLAADIIYPVAPQDYNNWKDTEAMIKFHLSAMDFQLRQLYRAMAMAAVLNRTLIIPRLKCYCYKNWFMMEQCRIPGDHVTVFPMDCNLDQFLRPKVLTNYGPRLQSSLHQQPWPFTFREYTLMQNPLFPPQLRQAQVVVQPYSSGITPTCPTCTVEKSAPDAWTDSSTISLTEPNNISEPASRRFVSIAANLTEVPFREALSKYSSAKVLRFRNLTDVFGGITDARLKESFDQFVSDVTSNWCCRDVPFVKQGLLLKERLSIQW